MEARGQVASRATGFSSTAKPIPTPRGSLRLLAAATITLSFASASTSWSESPAVSPATAAATSATGTARSVNSSTASPADLASPPRLAATTATWTSTSAASWTPMLTSLSPKQRESIRAATARLNLWHGSVRSGKTVATQVAWLQRLLSGPEGERCMVGKTELTLRRNVLNPLLEIVGPSRMSLRQHEAEILGRRCYLVGANDERAEAKIRGGTFVDAYGDEITLWPESFFDMLLSRMSVEGGRFYGTTNADGPRHWLKTRFLDRAAELDLQEFRFSLDDNPYLPPSYVATLRAETTGLWRKRFVDGLWVLAEGAIWDSFDSDEHVVDALPADTEIRKYWVGVDYGTSNPFVALLLGQDTSGLVYVLSEYRWDSKRESRQKTDAEYSAALAEWIDAAGVKPVAWYPDPSAASFSLQMRSDHGWPVHGADHDVLDGIRFVGKLLAKGQLRVLRRCDGLIAEMESYVWDPRAQERGEDKPLKVNDHGPDALRYALYSHLAHAVDLSDYGWIA